MWETVERVGKAALPWAQIASLVAIPVVVGVIGAQVSRSASDREATARMVEVAIEILRTPEEEVSDELRRWAVAIVDRHAPLPLPRSPVLPSAWFPGDPGARVIDVPIVSCGSGGADCVPMGWMQFMWDSTPSRRDTIGR